MTEQTTIIPVAAGKSGVGKTLVTANLAVALAHRPLLSRSSQEQQKCRLVTHSRTLYARAQGPSCRGGWQIVGCGRTITTTAKMDLYTKFDHFEK
jgi:hypothetical protein